MKLLQGSLIVFAILLVSCPTISYACNFGFGRRVAGDSLLHTIVVTKRATSGLELLSVTIDFKPNPLYNQEVTLASLSTESTTSCTFNYPPNDFSKEIVSTVTSNVPISELTVTMQVYGINRAN